MDVVRSWIEPWMTMSYEGVWALKDNYQTIYAVDIPRAVFILVCSPIDAIVGVFSTVVDLRVDIFARSQKK